MFSALIVSFLAPFAPPSHSVDHSCADTRAAEVDARVAESGTSTTCGIGISIFGLELSIGGPECSPRRFVYPAHQVCNGDANEGTWCGKDQALAVTEERCSCSDATLLGTGIKLPFCDCEFVGNAATIEDFGTFNCVPPHEGRTPPPRTGSGGGQ